MAKRAKKANSCTLWPMVGHQPSALYRDLLNLLNNNRPLANLVYASYLQPGVADAMDKTFSRNAQNEHSAKDVYEFLDVNKMRVSSQSSTLDAAKALGVTDSKGRLINFTDAEEAFNKAISFNSTNVGKVAYVVQNGDTFNVIIDSRDSRTIARVADVSRQQEIWEAFKADVTAAGIDPKDLTDAAPDVFNPIRITESPDYLESVRYAKNESLQVKDIAVLLTLGKDNSTVSNLLSRWRLPTKEAAQRIYDYLQNPTTATPTLLSLIDKALNAAKKFPEYSYNHLTFSYKVTREITPKFQASSKEYSIQKTLADLHEKYKIDSNIVIRETKSIKRLSDAAAEAILALERQLRVIESREGKTTEYETLEATKNSLLEELANKQYYAGLLEFLNQGLSYINVIDNALENLPTTGTRLENAIAKNKVIGKAEEIRHAYYAIIDALVNLDSVLIDESLSSTDKETLIEEAKKAKDLLDNQKKILEDLARTNMIDICTEYLGDTPYHGKTIAELINMSEHDLSFWDNVYSISEISNPLISVMGRVIQDAQADRNKKLSDISLRIRRATSKLYKAGHNTDFMYEVSRNPKTGKISSTYIASNYDWNTYYSEFYKARAALKRAGLKGAALKIEMERWKEANTIEEVVDHTPGKERTERVPIFKKDEAFDASWDNAQKEYYREMMELKGQLGSLLPAYAQHQYLPAQIRGSWLDIVRKGVNGDLTTKEVITSLLDRMKFWKAREDDTDFVQKTIDINGNNYVAVQSDFDDTPLRRIPIFYISPLESQEDLVFDFSGSLQSLAGTALNYSAMNSIKDTVELMGDIIKNQEISYNKRGESTIDIVKEAGIAVAKRLKRHSEGSNTAAVIDGFISKFIYGVELKALEVGKKESADATRFIRSLIKYTSFRQLTLNLKGGISNTLVGEAQMLIEAGAGEFYGIADYIKAHSTLVGNDSKKLGSALIDALSDNKYSKASLLNEYFDPEQEVYGKQMHQRYHTSAFRRLVGSFDSQGVYSSGEYIIHAINMYAVLYHEKVLVNGKKTSLYDALKVTPKQDGNATLTIAPNTTTLDGASVDEQYLTSIKNKIKFVNQTTHGAMNTEDKGIIHQRIMGRLLMNFRQWMVRHFARRFRGKHWDATLKRDVEGYWITTGKFIRDFALDTLGFEVEAQARWKYLDEYQKSNIRRALSELALLGVLFTVNNLLGEVKDHKKEWFYRMFMYQVKRLILDETASTPIAVDPFTGQVYLGPITEGLTILQSPISAVNTVNGLLYPITGLSDVTDTIKSGRYEGENTYLRNLKKYTIPFYGQIDQLIHMDEEDYVFNVFKSGAKASY